MSYQITCDVSVEQITTAGEAQQLLDDFAGMEFYHGRHAFTLFAGRPDADPQLRLDVDADAGRAAVTWLPGGSSGVQPGVNAPEDDLVVCESSDRDPVVVPKGRARVTLRVARQALGEYVSTGHRPGALNWQTGAALD